MLELKENIRLGIESRMWIFISAFLIVLDRYECWNVGLCSRKYGFCAASFHVKVVMARMTSSHEPQLTVFIIPL